MAKSARQLLRSVYRLLEAKQTDPAKAVAWAALKDEIEAHLVDTWEPETFLTIQSSINEKSNYGHDRAAAG